jgi:hypothetical protein
MILGVNGYARAGKDTLGGYLVEEHGFTRIAFADTLKRFALALNPIIEARWDSTASETVLIRLFDCLQEHDFSWEKAKEVPEVRQLLQRLGTEAGREILGEDVWVNGTFAGIDPYERDWVVTDVRFLNEAAAVKARSGLVWRVNREGTGPINSHASETAMDGYAFDAVLANDGPLEDLYRQVDEFLVRA